MGRLRAVFFDVGETLVDESREYGTWADWLGVPRHTFSAVLGAVIARGGDYRETLQHFRPGFDLGEERERRAAAGQPESFAEENLYPDARPCLAALRSQGVLVGLAGNQAARAEEILRTLSLPVDVIGTSDGWGAEKPGAAFFERLITEAGCPAQRFCTWVTGWTMTCRPRSAKASRPRFCGAGRGATSSTRRTYSPGACSGWTLWRNCRT